MLNGEKYELLRSNVDVMISFKHLVAFCAMLLVGWNPAFAATTDDAAAETGSTTTQTSKTHHKKHHSAKTAAADSTSPADKTGGDAAEKSSSTASASKTTTAATTKTSTDANVSSAATKSSTAATATGKSHKKKGRNSTVVSTNGPVDETKTGEGATVTGKTTNPTSPDKATSAVPAGKTGASSVSTTTNTNSATPPAGMAAAAATAVTGQAAVATTGKGKHRRHGAATPPVPQPPIVVNPAAVPPPTLPVSTASVTTGTAPKIETVLPVPRPGAGTTASLPLAMIRNPSPESKTPFFFKDEPMHPRTRSYPWKNGIVTTVFWIGEGSTPISAMTNLKSAWDGNWVHNNGGADDQYDMSGYGSGSHASTLNPFYIALPFNDLAYPDKTSRWLPNNWSKPPRRGNKPVSACQHRWIEIKNRAGRVCFAQWEDVGPIVTDDAEYVFGPSRPSANRGLDVSPAVAKYLGIDSTAVTSWRFVDDEDVLPGMWLRYDEQALLFRAMKEKLRGGGANTRIQQLEEPTPEDDDNDANRKRIDGARG